jgi:hypothetical protein
VPSYVGKVKREMSRMQSEYSITSRSPVSAKHETIVEGTKRKLSF